MGTTWQVRLAAPAGFDRVGLDRAIRRRLDMLVGEMSHWNSESVLSRFNRAAAGSWTLLPPDFATVMTAALAVAETTDGAFDPTLGALANLWGFGPVKIDAAPSEASIAEARAVSGRRRIAFDTATHRLRQPGGLALDLSGIAKGYAVDAITALLAERGVGHCLTEIGGELSGRGMRPDGDPWWVDLEVPPTATIAPFRIALHATSVATSGAYVRGNHNLDPATGRPAAHDVVSVSVLHPSAMIADAWASALTVLGAEAGLALAGREDVAARIVTRRGAHWVETISPALAALL